MSDRHNKPGLGAKIKGALTRFMAGRYGTDRLNNLILWTGVILCLASMLIPWPLLSLVVTALAYGCMGWALFRCFSRNTYKRGQENRKYTLWRQRRKDREHKYFACPKCRQSVRVPKGKGKIAISCPRCREKFTRKT